MIKIYEQAWIEAARLPSLLGTVDPCRGAWLPLAERATSKCAFEATEPLALEAKLLIASH